ncbi:MAG: hypothetical protein RR517_20200 [Pseudomonas sp.]
MSDFQATSEPVARKPHTYCECGGNIGPGHKYQLVAGSWEGEMDSYRTCMPCVRVRDWATNQPEWCGDGEHLFYFEMLEGDFSSMATEIEAGDGRRFKAYRFLVQMAHRRGTSREQKAA